MARVALALAVYVIAGTLWVRGQHADSLAGGVWTPPWWLSALLLVGGLGAGGVGIGSHSTTAVFAGIVAAYFGACFLVIQLREHDPEPTSAWTRGWVVALAVLLVAAGLGARWLGGSSVPLVAAGLLFGAGVLLAPIPLSVLSARALRRLREGREEDTWHIRWMAVAGALLVAGAGITAYREVPGLQTVAWLAAAVLFIVAIVSSTGADSAVLIAVLALLGITPPQEPPPPPFDVQTDQVLVAMGDSYMSGEGAHRFFQGTDDADDQCRRAPTAWAAKAAQASPFDGALLFVACSGALTRNVRSTDSAHDDQHEPAPKVQHPGEKATQLDQYLAWKKKGLEPTLVVLSLGGNDAGFSTVAQMCLAPGDCEEDGEKYWLSSLSQLEPELAAAYHEVREVVAPAPVVVVGYPDPIYRPTDADPTPADCSDISLSEADRRFVSRYLKELNDTVAEAAADAGILYLDTMETSLRDAHLQLCDPGKPSQPGLNFLVFRSVRGEGVIRFNPANIYHNSMHPNERGHEAMLKTFDTWIDARNLDTLKNPDPRKAFRSGAAPPASTPFASPAAGTSGDLLSEPVADAAVSACQLYERAADPPAVSCRKAGQASAVDNIRKELVDNGWGLRLLVLWAGAWLLAVAIFARLTRSRDSHPPAR